MTKFEKSKNFISTAQNYQDVFALMCNNFKPGVFVDVGCSTPENVSNVVLLLNNKYYGLGFDMDSSANEKWKNFEKMKFINIDITKNIDILKEEISKLPEIIDYLNIDLDGQPSVTVLENLNFKFNKFKCITIEHDAYRFGDIYKGAQRDILLKEGYEVVITTAAEDWYVYPSLIEKDYYKILKNIPEHMIYDHNVHDIKKFIYFEGIHKGPY